MKKILMYFALCALLRSLGYAYGEWFVRVIGGSPLSMDILHWGVVLLTTLSVVAHVVVRITFNDFNRSVGFELAVITAMFFVELVAAIANHSDTTTGFTACLFLMFAAAYAYMLATEQKHSKTFTNIISK